VGRRTGPAEAAPEQIQRIAYDEVLYIPFGQVVQPTAYRRDVTGVLRFPAPLFWNVSVRVAGR